MAGEENHASHNCVDEYVHWIKTDLDEIEKMWSERKLSCRAVKRCAVSVGISEEVDLIDLAEYVRQIKVEVSEMVEEEKGEEEGEKDVE